ncbi:MAG: DnaJ domain-containing protein [Clostridia bacterium]|nr:DnaJ domain-containing protein [Clostridia bacterium]
MKDPYEILGVGSRADEQTVRAAYKKAAAKYHPFLSDDSENNSAKQKMSELDEAYDFIISRLRDSGGRSDDDRQSVSEYVDVRKLIADGRLDDAEEILDGVGKASRFGEWNYLKAYILYKRGWLDEAGDYVSRAVKSDPRNEEFARLYNELNDSKSGSVGGYFPGLALGCAPCSMCMSLLCCDICCGCLRRK